MTDCYAQGTRIATVHGEIAIEALRVGDLVHTLTGGPDAPVTWLGHARVACATHSHPSEVMPVRICGGAFGQGRPSRDLVVSPDHAVFVEGVLIPIRHLINNVTIAREIVTDIVYWHVELPRHAVILAEGLPAESYLDTGNRGALSVLANMSPLDPDFSARVWAQAGCAPLVTQGPVVAEARRRLRLRAAELGREIAPEQDVVVSAPGLIALTVPASGGIVRIVSTPRKVAGDSRMLGACINRILLDGRDIFAEYDAIGPGFHGIEGNGAQQWRWTDGDAALHLPPAGLPRELRINVTAMAPHGG
jgi:hypothetical protein